MLISEHNLFKNITRSPSEIIRIAELAKKYKLDEINKMENKNTLEWFLKSHSIYEHKDEFIILFMISQMPGGLYENHVLDILNLSPKLNLT